MSRGFASILLATSGLIDKTALALWREDRLMNTGVWEDAGWFSLPTEERQRWRRLAYAAALAFVDPEMLAKLVDPPLPLG